MRLLFVSSTTIGGSGRSQRELAGRLERRGHVVNFLVDDGKQSRLARWMYGHLSDLAARMHGHKGARVAAWLERQPGGRPRRSVLHGREHYASPIPQNALDEVVDRAGPDVVIGNSLERLAWIKIHDACSRRGIPTVLYVRETDSLQHVTRGAVPDVLVANAESLRRALNDAGFACEFVPSVIDVDVTRTESSRRAALSINPIATRGGDLVWKIAAAAPDVPFVVQESWSLEGAELAEIQGNVARLDNVEFRRVAPPGPGLYGDARVLLVPHRVDNRPRVIAEAQANAIPVVAADVPALREAIGEGGVTVPLEDVDAWVRAVRRLWTDDAYYRQLADAALQHSKRHEIDPDAVAAQFEALVQEAVRTV